MLSSQRANGRSTVRVGQLSRALLSPAAEADGAEPAGAEDVDLHQLVADAAPGNAASASAASTPGIARRSIRLVVMSLPPVIDVRRAQGPPTGVIGRRRTVMNPRRTAPNMRPEAGGSHAHARR